MSFLVKDKKSLEKYDEIWEKGQKYNKKGI